MVAKSNQPVTALYNDLKMQIEAALARLLDPLPIFTSEEERNFQDMMRYRRLRLERMAAWVAVFQTILLFPVDYLLFPKTYPIVMSIRLTILIGAIGAFLLLNPLIRPARWKLRTTTALAIVNAGICLMTIIGERDEPGTSVYGFCVIITIAPVLLGAGRRPTIFLNYCIATFLLIGSYFLSPLVGTDQLSVLWFQIQIICAIGALGYVAVRNREAALRRDFAAMRREMALHERTQAALTAEQAALDEQQNFVAMVSYEFRAPIDVIRTASDFVKRTLPKDAKIDVPLTELARIDRATLRLTSLIEAILMEDRLNATVGLTKGERLSLADIGNEVIADIGLATGRQISRSALPGDIFIAGDRLLIYTVFRNLLDNAIKYSPAGSEIVFTAHRDRDHVVILVQDHGAGIAPAEVGLIFEKYFRSAATEHKPGAGLGLYVVRRIIELHGGSITAESEVGKGSTFTVILPLAGPPGSV